MAAEVGTSKPRGGSGSHNMPIGCGASGAYAPGPVEDRKNSLTQFFFFQACQLSKVLNEAKCFGSWLCFCLQARNYLSGDIVRSELDVPTFATGRVHTSPRESTQRRKVELWARNVQEFCLNANSHVTFRDLLHAVKLRHGTDSFTSPPKEGVLRIFLP